MTTAELITLNNQLRQQLGLPYRRQEHMTAADISGAAVDDLNGAAAFEAEQKQHGGYMAASAARPGSPQLRRLLAGLPVGATMDEAAADRLLEQRGIIDPTQRIAMKFEMHANGMLRS